MTQRFNGSDYVPAEDDGRLTGQIARVFNLMSDSRWRTLAQIETLTSDPPASISAQLRHLRKKKWGAHTINKRKAGPGSGLWYYQLVPSGKVLQFQPQPRRKRTIQRTAKHKRTIQRQP